MTFMADTGRPRLVVSPQRPNLDTELHIRLHGVPREREVTLRASMDDPRGLRWYSEAVFRADGGTLDLHRDAPARGSYHGVDPMGLIWSMRPATEPRPDQPADFLAPTPFWLAAEVAHVQVAAAEVRRLRVPDGLRRTEVRGHGLVATLYRPDVDDPVPGVVMLGGAVGGMHEDDAALLAVMGASKGGEAALLVAATFPYVRAVVSVVGSGLLTQGISQDLRTGALLDILRTPVPNWTWQGQALPYLPNVVTPELEAVVAAGEPVALRLAFERALALGDLAPAATIPVERIHGAVLLISSSDDQGYGVAFHDVAAHRLATHHHPQIGRAP